MIRSAALSLGLALSLATPAWSLPEGTRDLQINQGLVGRTPVQVLARAGETLRFCSSDDGHNETTALYGNCLGTRCSPREGAPWVLEHNVDRERRVLDGRRGSEILLTAPQPQICNVETPCTREGFSCRTAPDGRPYVSDGPDGYCAAAFSVSRNGRGFCSAYVDEDTRIWQEYTVDAEGQWSLDFVGEAPTLLEDGRTELHSTRYFEVDVLDADRVSVNGGRVNALAWQLTAHSAEYRTDADFYVSADGHVFVLDLSEMAALDYTVTASRRGLETHPRASWCSFGDPTDARRTT